MSERKAPPGSVPFYKEVGGYTTLIKVRGRWYYAGSGSGEHLEVFAAAERAGVTMVRVGTPSVLKRAFKERGATRQTIIDSFPRWTEEVGFQ